MRPALTLIAATAALAGAAVVTPSLAQSPDPSGVWIDHTGRGAVEISDCGGKLCGRVVWVQQASNAKACGLQILGNVKRMSNGHWDRGWIYDPDENQRFDVEITPMPSGKLKVMGYAGSKMLSETMIWTRASGDIKRC